MPSRAQDLSPIPNPPPLWARQACPSSAVFEWRDTRTEAETAKFEIEIEIDIDIE